MKDLNTLGDILLKRYVTDFVAQMNQPGLMASISQWSTIEDDTNFGKLLHKENLWSLYPYKEEKSLLYHLCRNAYGHYELQNNPCDPETSQCSVCQHTAPDEIKGLWTLHNFEWVQGSRDV